MAEKDKKYFWLRLKRDFFKRHDIRIIESMPNGKEIVLFYLKLLCESVDHEGRLRFSETIPYTREMLASLTNTDMDIVDASMDILLELELVEYDDNQTYVMTGIDKLIGSETYWAEKKRQQRELDNVQPMSNQCPTIVQPMSNMSKSCPSKSKNIDKEIDIEIDIETRPFSGDEDINKAFESFKSMREQMNQPLTNETIKMLKENLDVLSGGDKNKAIKIINQSVLKGWKGFYALKEDEPKKKNKFKNFHEREYDDAVALERAFLGMGG